MLTTVCTIMIYMLLSVLLVLCFSLFAVVLFCAGPYFVLVVKDNVEAWIKEDCVRREKIRQDDDKFFTELLVEKDLGVLSEL